MLFPGDLCEHERRAIRALTRLSRVHAAYDSRPVPMKGPETTATYPRPGLRTFWDLDLPSMLRAPVHPRSTLPGW